MNSAVFPTYNIEELATRAAEWRLEAEAATMPAMRRFCLQEASQCERLIQRSLEVCVVTEVEDLVGSQVSVPAAHCSDA